MQLRSADATSAPDTDTGVLVEELASMVRARLDQKHLKLRDAAEQTGVSAATLSRVLNNKLPDTKTFAALVRWLGVSADLFIPSNKTASVPEAIEAHLRADRTLPADLARALADLVRATYAGHMAAAGADNEGAPSGHRQDRR
jgi:transcriptional regulator with XRE-family HTH domain